MRAVPSSSAMIPLCCTGFGVGLVMLCLLVPGARARLQVVDIFRQPALEGTRATDVILSPDEKWVAYSWNAEGWREPLNLYVVPSRGGKVRQLTHFQRDTSADSITSSWERLRNGLGTAVVDSLKELPQYFEDESIKHQVSGLVWSPDSRRLLFNDRGDLYMVDVRSGALRRLTQTNAAESQPSWSPDGRFVSFVRDRSIWLLDVDGVRELQLIEPVTAEQSINEVHWSPDSRRVAFLVQDDTDRGELLVPNYLPDHVKNESVREGYPDFSVRIVDLHPLYVRDDPYALRQTKPFTVRTLDLGEGNHPWVTPLAWSPDGVHLAVNEVADDMRTRTLHVAEAATGKVHVAFAEVDSAWIEDYDWVVTDQAVLEWSPDSRWITFTSERNGFHQLYRVDVSAETPEPKALTRGDWIVNWAQWSPDGEHLIVMTSRESTSQRHLERLNVATGALERLQTAPGMNTHPQMGKSGKLLLYRHSRFNLPPDVWAVEPTPSSRPWRLTDTVPERFREVDWTVPEIVHFPARDGVPLAGLLYKPKDFDPNRRYPVVVFVHGAGSMQNVVDGWTVYAPNYKFHTVLTQQGFVVFEVDYRGSLGYGHDFRSGVLMHMGGKDLDDERAGVDYLRSLDFVDASRIGIYGGSYGGFMALMALFLAPDDFACGAALRFVADWENYYRGNPWYCIQRLGKPEDHPAAYYRSSPIHFAENLQDPLLLLHGVRDDNVHFQDAAQLTERLIRADKDFELMIYPVERHGFTEPESWIDEYERIERFFTQHLQAQQPGMPAQPAGRSHE